MMAMQINATQNCIWKHNEYKHQHQMWSINVGFDIGRVRFQKDFENVEGFCILGAVLSLETPDAAFVYLVLHY